MAHFYEPITSKKVDPVEENNKIKYLFMEKQLHYSTYSSSLSNYIDENYFRNLKISTNHLNIASFFVDATRDARNELEEFLYYCEAMFSIIIQLHAKFHNQYAPKATEIMLEITKIINYDLDMMNLSTKSIETEKFGTIIIIVPNDEIVENVLKNTKDDDIKDYLIEYESSHNKGNIKAKEELLKLLSNHIEGITKNKKYRDKNERLFDDADFSLIV